MSERTFSDKDVKLKLASFKKLVDKCAKSVSESYPWFKANTVVSTVSASEFSGVEKINITANSKSNNFACILNFSVKDIMTKNAATLRGDILRKFRHNALEWKNAENNEKQAKIEKKQDENADLDKKLVKVNEEKDFTRKEAKEIIARYLTKFLKDRYRDQFKKNKGFGIVADYIANNVLYEIENGKTEFTVRDVIGKFFNINKLNKIAKQEADRYFDSDLQDARTTYLTDKVKELALVSGKELTALNYQQQYEALKSSELQEKFKNLKLNNIGQIKDFCETCAMQIMNMNGLSSIEITYKNEGALGTYIDNGHGNQRLNINLSKIKSTTELYLTIVHELKHAVDSSINQHNADLRGESLKDGRGLLNNISESIKGSGMERGTEGYKFLLKVKRYCYHVNPNERSARNMEINALMLIADTIDDDDVKEKEKFRTSLKAYVDYQQKTINNCSKQGFEALKQEYETLKAKGVDFTETAEKMISERFKYIEDIIARFGDTSIDEEVMDKAKSLHTKFGGRTYAENTSQSEQERIKQEEIIRQSDEEASKARESKEF